MQYALYRKMDSIHPTAEIPKLKFYYFFLRLDLFFYGFLDLSPGSAQRRCISIAKCICL